MKFKISKISITKKIFIGLFLGIILGILFYKNDTFIAISSVVGSWFLHLVYMLVIPIIISNVIIGLNNIKNSDKLIRLGIKTLVYFEILSISAICIGLIIGTMINFNNFMDMSSLHNIQLNNTLDIPTRNITNFQTFLINIVPYNIFNTLTQGDFLGILFFSIVLSLGIMKVGRKAEILIDVSKAISKVMFKLVNGIMHFAPVGIAGLIGLTVAKTGIVSLIPLTFYMIIIYFACFLFFLLIIVPILKINHFKVIKFLKYIKEELLLGFSTSSSETTLPMIMKKMEKLGVKKEVTSFVIPLGYTMNLDAAGIYQALAVLFLTQVYNIPLDAPKLIMILFSIIILSKGVAGVAGASIIIVSAVSTMVGVPPQAIVIIAAVDRFTDMIRTLFNVIGNSTATLVIANSENMIDRDKYNKELLKK
ncbi:MAG: dicarboxylate/amino acid:cation symporter [Methanobrevibacter sp.]|jgi:DAACS family dicarboxylate/amino acid:cation (Na+ or H+) symporter/proton glutamate symport protein|nr:dicarboxylate/amino acid:cation symporter [Candidatus Methanovirga basalitermitum]